METQGDNETQLKLALYGYGEWIDEPDKLQFEHMGIKCLILRNESGALCGYCELPEGHKYYAKDYEEILYLAHGGLTFSGNRKQFGLDGFWIGFDCSHSFDITPECEIFLQESRTRLMNKMPALKKMLESSPIFNRTYKNIAFVEQECKQLAKQIINDQEEKT